MSVVLPVPRDARARRVGQLYVGLVAYGFSSALMVEAALGLNPWDVLHQGISRLTGVSIGLCTVAVGVTVLLLWVPLRQRAGLGTLSNAIVIGLVVDASLALLPDLQSVAWRSGFLAAGILLNGMATGLYIGAGLGPGPRDGLMTGLARNGRSIRLVRTLLELFVLGLGWLLGGSVGIGTVAYAVAIGPLAHVFIPAFTIGAAEPSTPPEGHASIA
jgi:uncharacterized membrane protein YczE